MGKYADRLNNRLMQRPAQAISQVSVVAMPALTRVDCGGVHAWAVRRQGLMPSETCDERKLYWPMNRYVSVHGSRDGRRHTLAFGLDYGPLGVGRLYALDPESPAQHRHVQPMADLAPNPYGLVQVPATLSLDEQDNFYIVLTYLAAPDRQVDDDAPTGALLRMKLGADPRPRVLHVFLPDQGQPACLPPILTAACQRVQPTWVLPGLGGTLRGSLVAGAPRHWPPRPTRTGRPVQYEINGDGSGFRLIPSDGSNTRHVEPGLFTQPTMRVDA